VRQVPGRKTDVKDCQWLQELHTYGLLRGAFRPEDEVCVLRSYLRQRSMLVAMASRAVQHMQKALEQMNLKLTEVVSDITGKTGMTILRAILAGERDPQLLATYRDKRCKHVTGCKFSGAQTLLALGNESDALRKMRGILSQLVGRTCA
jgi:transposase